MVMHCICTVKHAIEVLVHWLFTYTASTRFQITRDNLEDLQLTQYCVDYNLTRIQQHTVERKIGDLCGSKINTRKYVLERWREIVQGLLPNLSTVLYKVSPFLKFSTQFALSCCLHMSCIIMNNTWTRPNSV